MEAILCLITLLQDMVIIKMKQISRFHPSQWLKYYFGCRIAVKLDKFGCIFLWVVNTQLLA